MKDSNCNEVIDDDAVDRVTYYADEDGDGFEESDFASQHCEQPENSSPYEGDCNDDASDPNATMIHPEAIEICNGLDDDCDNILDSDAADHDKSYMSIMMEMTLVFQRKVS